MADYLFEEDLKKLVQISKANKQYSHHYEVVFVSSCYSEFAGKVFLSSGARHVICIKQNERISDKASLRFSKIFYETLFVKKYSVCKAFEIAKEDIRTLINNGEANKFILMVNNNEMTNKSQKHVCFPIATFKEGKLTKHGNDPIFNSIPTIPENFRGRQQEICEVISLISKSRLVNILGPPGIGKTSISRFICNHLKDRKKFSDGILYLSLRGCESAQMFLTRLSICIVSNYEENKLNCIYQNDEISSPIKVLQNYNNKLKYEEVVDLHNNNQDFTNLITQVLRNKELLLVLDNCEDPLEDDCDLFVHQLDMLLDECSSIKIMLTSRKYINKLEHNTETPYHLYSLTPQASLKLLLDKTPREISNKEIEELLKYEIPSNHLIYQQFPAMNSSEITLTNHPFILMLGGHPQAISLAAPMLEHQTLTELFQQLIDSNIMDALSFKGKQSYTSLRISLEISINNIQKHNPQALDLFKFIGLLPGGVKQTELTDLWGDASWKSLKDDLIRASLLVYKPSENILTLLPFMNTRAYELLETEEFKKNEFHTKICRFYKKFLKSYEQKMNENSSDLNEFVEKEANIWACIYRSINRKKDNYEYDEEESNLLLNTLSDVQSVLQDDEFKRNCTMQIPNLLQFQYSNNEGNSNFEEIVEDEKEDEKEDLYNDKDEYKNIFIDNIDLELENLIPQNKQLSLPFDNKRRNSINNAKNERRCSIKANKFYSKRKIVHYNTSKITKLNYNTKDKFKEEEMLVIYYISIVIRLLKFSDGLKAINEYEKKEGLTKRAQAHIFKLKGVIGLLSDKSDESQIKQTIENFTKSLELFHKIGSFSGRAICRLALARVQGEHEFSQEDNKNNINSVISRVDKAKKQFKLIGHKLGEERANIYTKHLIKKLKGENDNEGSYQFLRLNTLKRNHNETVKQNESLLGRNILQNEDIKLFVEVIEKDFNIYNESNKYKSANNPRSLIKIFEIESILHQQQNNLSHSLSNSKLTSQIKTKNIYCGDNQANKARSITKLNPDIAQYLCSSALKVEPLFVLNKNSFKRT